MSSVDIEDSSFFDYSKNTNNCAAGSNRLIEDGNLLFLLGSTSNTPSTSSNRSKSVGSNQVSSSVIASHTNSDSISVPDSLERSRKDLEGGSDEVVLIYSSDEEEEEEGKEQGKVDLLAGAYTSSSSQSIMMQMKIKNMQVILILVLLT